MLIFPIFLSARISRSSLTVLKIGLHHKIQFVSVLHIELFGSLFNSAYFTIFSLIFLRWTNVQTYVIAQYSKILLFLPQFPLAMLYPKRQLDYNCVQLGGASLCFCFLYSTGHPFSSVNCIIRDFPLLLVGPLVWLITNQGLFSHSSFCFISAILHRLPAETIEYQSVDWLWEGKGKTGNSLGCRQRDGGYANRVKSDRFDRDLQTTEVKSRSSSFEFSLNSTFDSISIQILSECEESRLFTRYFAKWAIILSDFWQSAVCLSTSPLPQPTAHY